MAKAKLSARQKEIYDYICTFSAAHGFPPSVREIGNAVGLASPSTVHSHLKYLEDNGYIRRDSKKPRAIGVVSQAHDTKQSQADKTDEKLASVTLDISKQLISLPVVGRVAAGQPILAEQNVEEHLSLPISIVGDYSSFILRVRGDSMINAGIFDGDYIVVKEQQEAHNGEIVVALIDDSATVKTFYREKHRIRLQPENDTMEPIYVKDPIILGRVTALIRSIS
ncbi:transcriptional repressor LexA [Atopobium deltae]|uniref:LexA repressor n=1 Tax=Atopobium deltae TaxID=1393034 RepID=A0A133XS83_9ACTN|nr:transcriptional repressor LexA [Atopobium deltae]KXB33804.1 repressor LexA [Atopobium deltae]